MVQSKIRGNRRKPRGMRKRYLRRRKGMSYALSNRRALNPIPQRYICKMKYADNIHLGNGLVPFAYSFYRLNSVYDPSIAFGGHQPYGFDQISPLFTGYRVYKVSWRVLAGFTADTPITRNVTLAVTPIPSATTSWSNLANAIECPRTRWLQLSQSQGPRQLRGHVYLPKLTGVSKVEYRTDNYYSSAINGNPVVPMSLCMYVVSNDEVTALDMNSVDLQLELIYHVEFIGSTIQPQS